MLVVFLAGCEGGDPRIKDLAAGIGKDSATKVMKGPPTATEPYLVNSQYIETMFYPKPGIADSAAKQPRNMTPIVVVNGKVTGWGWDVWDSVAAANKIEVPPRP